MKKPWLKYYEKGVPASLKYPDQPLNWFLEESAKKHPDHAAIYYFDEKITFKELNTMAGCVSRALPDLGLEPGDRVAIMLPNCPQIVAAYYGVLKARGIVVQVNPLLSPPEAGYIIGDSGAKIMITLPRYENVYAPLLEQGTICTVVLTDVGDYASPMYKMLIALDSFIHRVHKGKSKGPGIVQFDDILAAAPDAAKTKHKGPSPEDTALIQYTGGTTGNPKGVILTHANLVANTLQCRAWFNEMKTGPGGDVIMGVTPFFHVYGMTVVMNLGIYTGCTMVLLPRFIVDNVVETIKKYKCTIFPGVELMYNALNHSKKSARGYLTSIRACISGAGPLYQAVQEKFESLTGGRVVEGYGLTEASPVTHCNPVFGERKIGSIGVPVSDTEAKIVDHVHGEKELKTGEHGELIVRGPQVMKGYWNKPEDTSKALRKGWLYTGDLAVMDQDGYFRILERKKDMIKTRGENVYPRNIEEVLRKHPAVADAVVVGLPDDALGEKIKAYIIPCKGNRINIEELDAYCRKFLAKFEIPQEFEFRKSLPKNLIGKVLRRKLREEEAKRAKK